MRLLNNCFCFVWFCLVVGFLWDLRWFERSFEWVLLFGRVVAFRVLAHPFPVYLK